MAKSCSAFWQHTPTVLIASGTALVEGYFTENYPLNAENRLLDMALERAATLRPTDINCIVYSTQNTSLRMFCFPVIVLHKQEESIGLCGLFKGVRSAQSGSGLNPNCM